jgi:DNA-binding MarR family transcriptional regulator
MRRRYAAAVDPLFEFALSVKALQREFERQANDVMQPFGLTGAQAEAVTVIGEAGPLSLRDLGGLLIAEAGHPSRLVDRLVAAGLVERRVADDDRRRIELSLTARGREVDEQIRAARQSVLELGRQAVGDRDLTPIMELMRELLGYTQFGELVERRRRLADGQGQIGAAGGRAQGRPGLP